MNHSDIRSLFTGLHHLTMQILPYIKIAKLQWDSNKAHVNTSLYSCELTKHLLLVFFSFLSPWMDEHFSLDLQVNLLFRLAHADKNIFSCFS